MANVVLVTRLFKFMKTKIINLGEEKLEIKQLPLRRYAELLKAIESLPKSLGGMDKLNNDQIFEQLPLLIANSLPDLIGILTIATDLKRENIEEMSLGEAVKIVIAVIEVNDYREVFEQIKKVMARPNEAPKVE